MRPNKSRPNAFQHATIIHINSNDPHFNNSFRSRRLYRVTPWRLQLACRTKNRFAVTADVMIASQQGEAEQYTDQTAQVIICFFFCRRCTLQSVSSMLHYYNKRMRMSHIITLVWVPDLHSNNRYTATRGAVQLQKAFKDRPKKDAVMSLPPLGVLMNTKDASGGVLLGQRLWIPKKEKLNIV